MTVGRMQGVLWTFFVVMCIGFLGVAAGMSAITKGLSPGIRDPLIGVVVVGLWWGPFVYAMYLAMVVVKNGDPRLLKRGIHGTAEVLTAKMTNEVIQNGGFEWEAPRVYKYKLRVTLPNKKPYDTYCSICASGIGQGATVNVAASPHNHKRVTIDVGQGQDGQRAAHLGGSAGGAGMNARLAQITEIQAQANGHRDSVDGQTEFPSTMHVFRSDGTNPVVLNGFGPPVGDAVPAAPDNAERIDELTKLGQLHSSGVLTDAEFASEKAKILDQ